MMRATSGKYKGLLVSFAGGSVNFVEGVAEVSEVQASALRRLPAEYAVTVEDVPTPAKRVPRKKSE